METKTFDAWADLVIDGQGSGKRQPCRLTFHPPAGVPKDGRVTVDRGLMFTAHRNGPASIVFFADEKGTVILMELLLTDGAVKGEGAFKGEAFSMAPNQSNRQEG